jgi:spore germination cell wall hydrolase CwlJ-like protein
MTTWDDYYKVLLALTMWREARGEGREGMRAVGHVIRNRVRSGGTFGDWDHVITSKWQFSSLTAPGDSQLVRWPDSPDDKMTLALQLAEDIYTGADPDITEGSLWYANLGVVPATSSFWASVVHNPQVEYATTIGNHTFYRKKTVPAPAMTAAAPTT